VSSGFLSGCSCKVVNHRAPAIAAMGAVRRPNADYPRYIVARVERVV